jgi:hypothetical protein
VGKEQEEKTKKAILKMLPPTWIREFCSNEKCNYEYSYALNKYTFDWKATARCPICNAKMKDREVTKYE